MNKYLKSNKASLSIWIVMSLLETFLSIYMALYLQQIIDIGVANQGKEIVYSVVKGIVFCVAIMLVNYFMTLFYAKYIKDVMSQLRTDIFKNIIRFDINRFNDEKSAKYISVLSNDMERVEQDYFKNIPNIVSEIVLLIMAIGVLFYFSPILAVINILISAGILMVPNLTGKKLESYQKEQSVCSDGYMSEMKEYFQGYEVIKSYKMEQHVSKQFTQTVAKKENAMYRLRKTQGVALAVSEGSANITFIINIILGIYMSMKGFLTIGSAIGVIQLINYIVYPINRIVDGYSRYKAVKAVNKRIEEILVEDDKAKEPLAKVENVLPVKLENVSFAYKGNKLTLKDINLALEPKKKYVVVGKSGSGKSTMVKLIAKYYDNYSGEILYDLQNGKEVDKGSLLSKLAMIQQNVIVFDDTLKKNIIMNQDYSEEEIGKAVEESGLSEFVKNLPNGLDTCIEENGRNISGGEKQRIAIARALIRKVPFMILDEATSSLDNENAYKIESSILKQEELTALVVTHRLKKELLEKYDCILVMKEGKLVEEGTFEELMEKKQYFYNLYHVSEEGA